MKLKTTSLAALAAFTLAGPASAAATVLYSENFNGEGTAFNAYTDGTTPEINVGGIGDLNSTGAHQGGNAGDTAWNITGTGSGERGLRFAGGYNWATGSNAATILLAGGFSVSFDFTVGSNVDAWVGVRVGSGGENSGVTVADTTFAALVRGTSLMQTFDNGAYNGFGTGTAFGTRNVQLQYAFNSWNAGTTVTFTGIMDGNTIATDTFTWDATNDMKIVLTGYDANTTIEMDNLVVATIPEPAAALLGGLGMLALLRRRR